MVRILTRQGLCRAVLRSSRGSDLQDTNKITVNTYWRRQGHHYLQPSGGHLVCLSSSILSLEDNKNIMHY